MSLFLTSLASDVTVQTREDQITVAELRGTALAQHQLAQFLGHGRCLLPPGGILVLLVGRALRGTNSMKFQERVIGQQKDESLTYGASGTQNT